MIKCYELINFYFKKFLDKRERDSRDKIFDTSWCDILLKEKNNVNTGSNDNY